MSRKKDKNTNQGAAFALGLAMLLGITGCANKEAAGKPQENVAAEKERQEGTDKTKQLHTDDTAEEGQEGENNAETAKLQEGEWVREEPIAAQGRAAGEPTEKPAESDVAEAKEQENGGQTIDFTEGTEHLGGKIQKLQEDGMTFAHTSLVDENMGVTLLDVEDAEKISVKYTAETKVEHWIIQGGGAGIDMQEAAFSDLKEGMGVELEGYYDGEIFVATKVIMEDYE